MATLNELSTVSIHTGSPESLDDQSCGHQLETSGSLMFFECRWESTFGLHTYNIQHNLKKEKEKTEKIGRAL